MSEHISVCVRIKPSQNAINTVQNGQTITIKDSETTTFVVDKMYGSDTQTPQIYQDNINILMENFLNGYNGLLMAYGQTNSGKTFTIKGLLELMVDDLFNFVGKKSEPIFHNLVTISYIEVYNEKINDLIGVKQDLDLIRNEWDKVVVSSKEQLNAVISGAEKKRISGSTTFNESSSRSHSICIITLKRTFMKQTNPLQRTNNYDKTLSKISSKKDLHKTLKSYESQLYIVDLAGSEAVGKGELKNDRKTEGLFINKSLLTLGNIIMKLSEGNMKSNQHIPYRESKLTRILQKPLSGNAKISLICTVSLDPECIRETIRTLQFAVKAKKVSVKAHKNEYDDNKESIKHNIEEIMESFQLRAEKNIQDHIDKINEANKIKLQEYLLQIEELTDKVANVQDAYNNVINEYQTELQQKLKEDNQAIVNTINDINEKINTNISALDKKINNIAELNSKLQEEWKISLDSQNEKIEKLQNEYLESKLNELQQLYNQKLENSENEWKKLFNSQNEKITKLENEYKSLINSQNEKIEKLDNEWKILFDSQNEYFENKFNELQNSRESFIKSHFEKFINGHQIKDLILGNSELKKIGQFDENEMKNKTENNSMSKLIKQNKVKKLINYIEQNESKFITENEKLCYSLFKDILDILK